MRRALREFGNKTRDADVAVIYYAGHGIELDGTNYLIPVDATLETDTDVLDETFPLDRVLFAIEPAKQLRLVILDACRDNPFAKTMKRTVGSRAIGRGLAKVEPSSPNTMIAFAAKAGSTASDGDFKNSPFATALVDHLAEPGLDLRKAFGFVRDDVLKATNNTQEPFVYGSLGGEDVTLFRPLRHLLSLHPSIRMPPCGKTTNSRYKLVPSRCGTPLSTNTLQVSTLRLERHSVTSSRRKPLKSKPQTKPRPPRKNRPVLLSKALRPRSRQRPPNRPEPRKRRMSLLS